MSKVIDNRVVSMEFDNAQFEKNVQTSMKTLDGLNKTLDNLPETSGKSLMNLGKAANKIDLSGISSGIDAINSKFSALGIAGQEVIRDITRTALNFGKNAWNMTFGQITSGGKRRAQNIASAKFTLEGMGFNFQDYYKDIDYAVTGTAYGFDQAAQAASVFASSGVKAGEDMKRALRGISGVAAMTGSSYEEIAYVFEQVNGVGKVTGNTLNMISGRGLNAAATLGKALGKSEEEIHKMVTKGQIDFATFAKAMDDAFGEHSTDADKTLSGVTDNIRAQLSRIGQTFYDPLFENDSGLVKMLQSVKAKIKELKPLIDPFSTEMANLVLHLAGIGKGLVEGIDVKGVEGFFKKLSQLAVDARTGVDNILNAITTFGTKLSPIAKVAREAFGEIFPKKFTGLSPIITLSRKLSDLSQKFFLSGETVDKFKRVFKGMFSAVSLGIKIFRDLLKAISPVTEKFKGFGSSLLGIAAKIGDFFTELNQNYDISKPFDVVLNSINKIKSAFGGSDLSGGNFITAMKAYLSFIQMLYKEGGGGVSGVINATFEVLIDAVGRLGDAFYNLTGIDPGSFFDNLQDSLFNAKEKLIEFINNFSLIEKVKDIIGKVKEAFSNLWSALAPLRIAIGNILRPFGDAIRQIGEALKDGLAKPGSFLNLAGMLVLFEHLRLRVLDLKFAFDDFRKRLKFLSGENPFNFFNNIDKTISGAKLALFQLTKELKAKAILEIAGAIAILAVSFMLLASVDSDKIVQAGIAMAGLIGAIAGLMKEMDSLGESGGFKDNAKISTIANSLIKISIAVLILAAAMKQMDGLDHAFQSIGVLTVVLAELVGVAFALNKLNVKSFNKIAISMILLAFAVKILASAMTSFDGLNWDDVGQGLLSITILLTELVVAAFAIDKLVKGGSFTKTAIGMIAMALSIKILASAVQSLGEMQPEQIAAGILGLIGIMVVLGAVVVAIDKLIGDMDFLKISTGFLMLGASIALIAHAFETLGNMNPDGVAQAMGMLAFALVGLMAVLLLANDAMLKAGAGMLLMAGAMLVFTAAVGILGGMELSTLIKGMVGLAAGLTILVVALHFLEGSIVGAAALLIVAVALVPFAAALMMLTSLNLADLAGTILVLVVALAALTAVCYAMSGAIVGAAALLVLSVALLAFGAACAILVALPLGDLAATLLVVAAAILAFAGLSALLTPLLLPMAGLAAVMLLISASLAVLGLGVMALGVGLEMIAVSGPLGATALLTFCTVLASNLATLGAASTVLTVLAAALLVLDAALLVAAVSIAGCAVALFLLSSAMVAFSLAAVLFSSALLLVTSSLKVGIENIKKLLNEGEFKKMAGDAISGLLKGFKEGFAKVIAVAKELGQKVIDSVKSFFGGGSDSKMGQVGGNAVTGFVEGFKKKISSAVAAAGELGNKVLSKVKSVLKIKSPSKEMAKIGKYTDEGMALGIKNNADLATDAAEYMADDLMNTMINALSRVQDAMNADVEPSITPVMNLSEIQNGIRSMDTLMDTRRAANIASNYNASVDFSGRQAATLQTQMTNLQNELGNLATALLNQPDPVVNANVVLQGDANGVFKVVRNANAQYTKMHGKSAFA